MSGKKYVPQGVYLVCDKGTKPSELKSLSYRETTLFGEHMCTKVDKMLIINFDPFGPCAMINGAPCTAPVTDWTNLTDSITLGGNELLLEHSELPCTLGGKIKIFYSMQDALGACPKPKKGFWASVGDAIVDTVKTQLSFSKGVVKGLWKGAKGLVTGVFDLAVWAGKHTPIYMVANPKGYAEQIQKDIQTAKSLGNLAKKGGTWVYRNSVVNLALNPNDYAAAQAENAVMMEKLYEKAKSMDAEEWGEVAGQILFEVVQDVATAGAGAAITSLKAADKVVDVAKAVDKLHDLDRALDTAKALDKIEDVGDGLGDGIKIAREIEDVKYLKKSSIFKSEDVLGRKVFKNGRDVTPGKPSFVDDSVHPAIKSKIDEGWTNKQLMEAGYAPIGPDGKQINLHHLIGKEPGTMVELTSSFHKANHKPLHGLIENGTSFRNNPKLKYQYKKFKNSYWKERAKDF